MPPMGPTSGKWGVVATDGIPVSTIRNWMVNHTADTKPLVASNTKGGNSRRFGNQDWTGSFEQFDGVPIVMPGQGFNFIGFIGPLSGTPQDVGPAYVGPAIVDNIALTINWETGDIITCVTNFSGNGEVQVLPGQDFVDNTTPKGYPSQLAKLELAMYTAGTLVYTPICVQQAVLNILANNIPVMDSCGDGWMRRLGGVIDWNMNFVCTEADITAQPLNMLVNSYVAAKLWINSLNYWDLKWALVKEYTNFTVERDTGKLINYTVNIEMSVDSGPNSLADGQIILPGAITPWFPEPVAP